MQYQPTIGLEIHAELKTKSKMFCGCVNGFGLEKEPNLHICPVCTGQPGSLPAINEDAVKMVIKTGLALNCNVAKDSFFERKNYFYPDLPKGYQISQYQKPLCFEGHLDIALDRHAEPRKCHAELGSASLRGGPVSASHNREILNQVQDDKGEENNRRSMRRIGITRIHLEEDTGKLIHPKGADHSLVDFNRAGVPLMELVTEPDIKSGEEAKKFCQELQLILRYLGVSDADMEKGQMRCEVNISLSNPSQIIPNESRMSRIVLADESYKIMGLLFEIHNKLGPVYKEINYQDAIEEVLKREKMPHEREKKITLKLEDLQLSNLFADFVVDNKILLEVKAKKFIGEDDIRQASRYIKSMNLPLAIIVNFKRQKLEYKRVINPAFENHSGSFVENSRNKLGTKVEIKNLNSFRAVERAIDYEIKRQSDLLDRKEKIVQETRGWDDKKGATFSQRIKEEAHDYRYFPEPDLPPLRGLTAYSQQLMAEIPELPQQKRERLAKEYSLPENDVEVFVQDKDLAEYFEQICSELARTEYSSDLCHPDSIGWQKKNSAKGDSSRDDKWRCEQDFKKLYKLAANYLLTEIPRIADKVKITDYNLKDKITSENFAEFVILIYQGKISSSGAQKLLEEMFKTGADPSHIIEEQNLAQVSDAATLETIADEVIKNNPKPVEDYKKGKETSLQFLIGHVMKGTKGKANPQVVAEILRKKLQ